MRPSYKRTRANFRKLFRFLTNFVTEFALKSPNYSRCLTEKHWKITCFQGGALRSEFLGHQGSSLFYNVLIDNVWIVKTVHCCTCLGSKKFLQAINLQKFHYQANFYGAIQPKNLKINRRLFFLIILYAF